MAVQDHVFGLFPESLHPKAIYPSGGRAEPAAKSLASRRAFAGSGRNPDCYQPRAFLQDRGRVSARWRAARHKHFQQLHPRTLWPQHSPGHCRGRAASRDNHGEDAFILVLAADHLIVDQPAFAQAVAQAKQLAQQGKLVTFGIQPESPETGYGYIEAEGNAVLRFVEKPSLEKAREYVASGRYFWNSGMFCFSAGTHDA